MIVALSRFKVANGLEGAVAAALANRPGLVDDWPGFLGLETFTDVSDATMFYLSTRWTSAEAFHAWHGSPAHRASHKWMPKGLRLDPAQTQLVELERLPHAAAHDMGALSMDATAAISAYLGLTRAVHVVRVDLDGSVQMANEAMTAHLGLTEPLRGRSIFQFLTEPDAAAVMLRFKEPTQAAPVHLNFCDATGQPFTLSSYITVYPDGYLILGEPVYGDQERLQRQLIEVNEELAALARTRQRSVVSEHHARQLAEADSQAKDEGLAVIAHELRQPLTAAMAAVGVLKQNPSGAGRAVQILDRQIVGMSTLVEGLLHASQVMRGAITLRKERADLAHLVQEAADTVLPDMLKRGQQLHVDVQAAPLPIDVDAGRIRQVLVNILSNATKYTPTGGSITVFAGRGENLTYCLRVRDTGTGISAAALGRVFDLFMRATSGGNGLGIGLAVAKRLVELHDGTIAATSDGIGCGSEFSVTLPQPVMPTTACSGTVDVAAVPL